MLQKFINQPLAVVCHDAGAANIIIEWLKTYKGDVRICMMGPSKSIFQNYFPDYELYSLINVLDGVEILLSGTGWGETEKIIRSEASKQSIKNIAVIDHWTNYKERFSFGGREELPDEIIVCDNYAYKMAKNYFPSASIMQFTNNYLLNQANKAIVNRSLKCRNRIQNILIIAEPIRHDDFRNRNKIEFLSIEFFMRNLHKISISNKSVNFKIRLHPSESEDKYNFIKEKYQSFENNFEIINSSDRDLYLDISWADLVLGMNSFALVVSITAKVPTICILPPNSINCVLPQQEIIHLRDL